MVQEKYGVQLSTQEKGRLRQMSRAGRSSAQAITRARILLKTDQGWTASQVAAGTPDPVTDSPGLDGAALGCRRPDKPEPRNVFTGTSTSLTIG